MHNIQTIHLNWHSKLLSFSATN